jgi:hypothetical protein
MEDFTKKQPEKDWQLLIEQSDPSYLTKEIAEAIIEVKKMQNGELRPLTLEDI